MRETLWPGAVPMSPLRAVGGSGCAMAECASAFAPRGGHAWSSADVGIAGRGGEGTTRQKRAARACASASVGDSSGDGDSDSNT